MPERDCYAAVDLGSNSFHMVVARREQGQLRPIDSQKEMVRLAAGLDGQGRLNPEVRDRALECLARFGQRIRPLPRDNIRAAGTQTLRRLHHPGSFLVVAETALGAPIDIISGREEARLVYLGVSEGMAHPGQRRLVLDIGGGSTEFALGNALQPEHTESLSFGCVTVTREFFPRGRITSSAWDRASRSVMAELQEVAPALTCPHPQQVIGSSGSNRAILSICQARGWCESTITRDGLDRIGDNLLQAGNVDQIELPGLSEQRRAVIVGAVLVLQACFRVLDLHEMEVSDFALREGLLYDLLGRREHTDPRDRSIRALAERYRVDPVQAERVENLALRAFDGVGQHDGNRGLQRDLLAWTCRVHEAGLAISHSRFRHHTAYILEESDLPGFTRQEQQLMAALARHHRGKLPSRPFDALPSRLHARACRMLVVLRLAITLARSRNDSDLPEFSFTWEPDGQPRLDLDPEWLAARPLTAWGLEQQRRQLKQLGIRLETARPGR